MVGGRAFTSTILQKNCHEFIAYESIIDDSRPRSHQTQQREPQERLQRQPNRRVALDLAQAMPLVERALGVLERREVRPQLGLLKSTMLQLDSTFNEKAYGASSFTDFVEKLQKAEFVEVSGGEGRYMIRMKGAAPEKQGAKPEQAIPILRDVLETHRLEVDNGALADELAEWVRQERPSFDPTEYGFQEFSELLNYAQDKSLVRIVADEEKGLIVYLGAEFHPPAPPPEAEPVVAVEEYDEIDEPQPLVPGQPTATGEIPLPEPPPKPMRRPRARKPPGEGSKKRTPRPRSKKQPVI